MGKKRGKPGSPVNNQYPYPVGSNTHLLKAYIHRTKRVGLRLKVGNAGVVVDWACEASVVVVAWAWKRRRGGGGLGLRSRRGGGLGLPISAWWWLGLADLADLGLGLPISA
uniref:Uncharacterized protein n=1 Tax=Fagus sylvatica TaxID=28930 RepID=A0A2N9ETL1_FAGSY